MADKYKLFNMCPFTMAEIGGGGSISGWGGELYTWTHNECIGMYCRLWTFVPRENGEEAFQGCSLELIGKDTSDMEYNEIVKEYIKNKK